MRLVTRNSPGSPRRTCQRASTPAPRTYPRSGRSISATPPPCDVEFTFQRTRPVKRSRATSRAAWSAWYCAGSATCAKASSDLVGIGTLGGPSRRSECCTLP